MSSTPMNQKKSSSTRTRSRSRSRIGTASSTAASRRRRRAKKLARACLSKRRGLGGGPCSSSSSSNDVVSEKLEALRNLIPVTRKGADDSSSAPAEELFQETAEYILRLRTQVVILQKLVRFYGSTNLPEEQREMNDASSVL